MAPALNIGARTHAQALYEFHSCSHERGSYLTGAGLFADTPRAMQPHALNPDLQEWLDTISIRMRADYQRRAESLLKDAPTAANPVMRLMISERRLALWAIRAERSRRKAIPLLREALKELATAERDATRAWADYVKERDADRPAAGRGYVDLIGLGAGGTPGESPGSHRLRSGGPDALPPEKTTT